MRRVCPLQYSSRNACERCVRSLWHHRFLPSTGRCAPRNHNYARVSSSSIADNQLEELYKIGEQGMVVQALDTNINVTKFNANRSSAD